MHIHPQSTSPTRRRGIVSGLASLALAVSGSLVALPPSALADTTLDLTANQNVVDRPSDSFTADSLPTVQIDSGVVRKQVISGNTVFVGGKFSNARPAGAAPGTSLVGRSNLMSYDITTGVMTDWNPQVNGEVTALAVSPDGSRLYVGGSFTQVDGQARSNLAAFDTATGQLVADFAPAVNAQVGVILATNDAVYLGGYFTNVAGSTRLRLAALTPAGALTAWAPTADGYVGAMALTAQGSHLVVGGQFAYVNGAVAQGSAALDVATGTSLPWAANTVITNHGESSGIYSLVADGDDVLATGWKYNTSNEGNFEGVVRLSGSTGQVVWMADCHGDSYGAVASHGLVYSVSHHHNCQNMGNFSDQGVFERAQAFTDKATSTTLTNQSGGYANFAGQPAPSQVAWAPALEAGTATGADQAAWNITSDDRYLLMGGEFPTVNGQNQQGIARFAAGSLATHQAGPARWAATPWSARATAVGNSVRVSVPINYDYDGLGLTYEVHRTDRSAALYTVSANSVWWTKNSIAFTDTSVEPNTHYDYYVTATDADGNTQRSNTAPVTTGAKANTAYQDLLMAGSPTHLWRLDDPAGSAQAADLAGASDLVPTSGVTFGQPGAVTAGGTGATLAGGQSSAYEENPEAGPSDYTAELWFKTTTTTGGRLLGFGNAATGSSWSYDRNVWMGDDGRINYGNYSNGLHFVTSPQAYNDGQWHHVATTSSPTRGTILYVDGVQVAQTDGYASDTYTGYWRIGQGSMDGWPNTPTSASFTGSIDEVAVYGKALSAQAIRSHYLAATGESVTASPYDPYGKAVYQAQPRLYWRLDETSGTVAQDASGLADDGTVSGDTTWGAASTVAPGTALSVNGGQVVSPRPVTNPLVFSLEGWVRTTSTTGGRILGLGDKTSGTSSHYDRALWTDASGKVHFGVYAGREVVLTSPSAINDGQWHQVVATLDPSAGMVLYVDGVAVASDPNTSAESYTGYWRAGADQTWDGAGSNIGGDLDELAVYDRAVTADEVAKRYALKGYETSTNQLPTASFTATTDGMSATVDGSASSDPDGTIGSLRWDFGDGTTATGAKATHVYTTEGTHTITLTVTDNLGGTATTTRQVTTAKPVVTDGTVALDDFSSVGSDWGTADAGGAWTVSKANVFSRDGASGIASIAKGADVKARLADVNALDTTAVLDESIDKLPGGGGLYSRLHVRDQGNTSYAAMLRWQSNGALRLAVIRYVGGVQSGELGGYDIPAGYTAGQVYRVKLSATGTNPTVVTASAWPADGTEPTTPQVTVKDTTAALQASGGVSVSGYLSGASTVSPVTLRVDGLRATGTNPTVAPTATPTATPTSTPTATPTSTPTDTPTPTPTPTVVETPVVTDAFGGTRTRWGSADLGGTYTYGTSSAFTTANGQGVMTVPKGVTARASLPATAGNLRTGAKVSFGSLPSAGSLYTRLEAHVQPNGDRLWAAVRLTSTGTMQLSVSQVVGGVQTDLKTVDVPGTYTPGTVVRLDFTLDTANGQTVGNARLLPLDQDTPLAQAEGTSTAASVQSAGTVGLSSYLSSTAQSPVAVQVDDYVVATH